MNKEEEFSQTGHYTLKPILGATNDTVLEVLELIALKVTEDVYSKMSEETKKHFQKEGE